MKIAHISDIHLWKIGYGLGQFFSKRWLGNANLIAIRRREFPQEAPTHLIEAFEKEGITHVLMTGDYTTTGWAPEFKMARRFANLIEEAGMTLFSLPGNHDVYTRRCAANKEFYRYFPQDELRDTGVCVDLLCEGWHLVRVDTAVANNLYYSTGYFAPEVETRLREALMDIPLGDRVIVASHYPFFQNESPRRILKRGEKLEALLREFPSVEIYTHGHTHRHTVADLRASGLPLILDSGSCTMIGRSTWNLIEIEKQIKVKAFTLRDKVWHGKEMV